MLFSCPLFSSLFFHLKSIHNTKAPGGGRKALTISLPQTKSTTQTRPLLNPNAPNLPQLPTAHVTRLEPSRWSSCIQNPAAETLRTRATGRAPSLTGLVTVLRLHGRSMFEKKNRQYFLRHRICTYCIY